MVLAIVLASVLSCVLVMKAKYQKKDSKVFGVMKQSRNCSFVMTPQSRRGASACPLQSTLAWAT